MYSGSRRVAKERSVGPMGYEPITLPLRHLAFETVPASDGGVSLPPPPPKAASAPSETRFRSLGPVRLGICSRKLIYKA